MEENQSNRSLAARGLAIVGVVAVLLIGAWLAVAATRFAPEVASSLGSAFVSLSSVFSGAEQLTLETSSETIISSVPFTLSWTHTKKEAEGSYTFSYYCTKGVYFTSPEAQGSETIIYCNTPFRFIHDDNTLVLVPHLSDPEPTQAIVAMQFTENGKTSPSLTAEKSISIQPSESTSMHSEQIPDSSTIPVTSEVSSTPEVPTSTIAPNTSSVAPGQTETNTFTYGTTTSTVSTTGSVDLRAYSIAIGYVDPITGEFTATSTVTTSHRAAIKFAVENIGTRTSGAWDFIAVLPTRPFRTFTSPQQVPLNPGDKIEFTLGFDQIEGQRHVTATITVDPTYQTFDADRSNNVLRQELEVVN